jgi:hypothetical protein
MCRCSLNSCLSLAQERQTSTDASRARAFVKNARRPVRPSYVRLSCSVSVRPGYRNDSGRHLNSWISLRPATLWFYKKTAS